jgi:hypothetical protein
MVSSNPNYLGTFVKEYKLDNKLNETDISSRVNATYKERVIAISKTGKWEQEIMHFSVIMEKELKEIDIMYVKIFYKL